MHARPSPATLGLLSNTGLGHILVCLHAMTGPVRLGPAPYVQASPRAYLRRRRLLHQGTLALKAASIILQVILYMY
jgi:hypothetical protein